MFDFSRSTLISYALILPIILLALSIHETAHGYIANKLGDPTAKSLGRLTLNPIKHIDIFGFLCMMLFHFGWAKPVPINVRYFKNPRRGMALTAAAGPVSNILLAFVFAALLRLEIFVVSALTVSVTVFNMICVLNYILYMGVLLNINLAVFNLIPIPPFDGSRIAHVFLPQKLYFRIMKYEQYIMIAILLLLWFVPFFSGLISTATNGLADLVLSGVGLSIKTEAGQTMNLMIYHLFGSLFA
ncbi:MAG: site-2 protease family protein [Ruminococcaceae bacterium]|nr:site-2 protease family protein [Oscillospiraceae bacterium]